MSDFDYESHVISIPDYPEPGVIALDDPHRMSRNLDETIARRVRKRQVTLVRKMD